MLPWFGSFAVRATSKRAFQMSSPVVVNIILCPQFARNACEKISTWLQYVHSRWCPFGSQFVWSQMQRPIAPARCKAIKSVVGTLNACFAAGGGATASDLAVIGGSARLRTQTVHHERDGNDKIQTRVHLARRLHADAKPAGQDPAQGFRLVPDAGAIAAVGLRWLLDHAGGRPQLRLHAQTRRRLSRWRAHQRRVGHVRSDDAGRQGRMRRTSAPPSSTIPAPGSASSRNISSTRTADRSASRRAAIRRRKARTTPASATRMSATSPARWSMSISISASPPASTTKASMPKWPKANGSSRFSARAQKLPPTRCGWRAI